jgi:hypothetical protein
VNEPLRFRYARTTERVEPYGFVFALPLIWLLPYGVWTWFIAWTPDALATALRWLWRKRAPIVVTAQRSGSGVVLLDGSGARVDGFEDSDVDALTTIVDARRRSIDLRVDRKGKRALVFELSGDETPATVAKRLGVDIHHTRSRYQAASIALQRLVLPFFAGLGCVGYSLVGSPDAETAQWLNRVTLYAFFPILLVINIPTALDVGRDGVAWRWLFIRRYLAFSNMVSLQPFPLGSTGDKVASIRMTKRDGTMVALLLGKKAAGAGAHLVAAFEASNRAAPPPSFDDWLPRIRNESMVVWVQRLRAKAGSEGTYRGADVRHLWPLAENLATPHDLRCAMLLVLATTDEARARTRALATHIVDPDVQAVYAAIANGAGDDEVARLLANVSPVTSA